MGGEKEEEEEGVSGEWCGGGWVSMGKRRVVRALDGEKGWFVFFFPAEDGIRGRLVTGVQTCALPIFLTPGRG